MPSAQDWRSLALGARRIPPDPAQDPVAGFLSRAIGLDQPSLASRMVDQTRMEQARLARGEYGPAPVDSPEAMAGFNLAGNFDFTNPFGAIIRAYHGTGAPPFPKFSDQFIGKGQGAATYGVGHYLAENMGVGEDYRRSLAAPQVTIDGRPPLSPQESQMATRIANGMRVETRLSDIDSLIDTLQRNIKKGEQSGKPLSGMYYGKLADARRERETWASFKDRQVKVEENPGTLMTADVDVEHEDLLDWDLPLSQQPEKVRKTLEGLGVRQPKISSDWAAFNKMPGSQQLIDDDGIIQGFVFPLDNGKWQATGPNGPKVVSSIDEAKKFVMNNLDVPGSSIYSKLSEDPAKTSNMLREAGIPGLRYLDQGSRDKGEGTRNLVMFDPELIKILEARVGGMGTKF